MEHVMKEWQQRKRGVFTNDTGGMGAGSESNVMLPLSEGEWDEPLGLPLCVVCHGVSAQTHNEEKDSKPLRRNFG